MAGGAKVPKFRKITKARKDENRESDSFIYVLNSPGLLKKRLYAVWQAKARRNWVFVTKPFGRLWPTQFLTQG